MLACRRLFFLGFIGRSPSAGGNAFFPPAGTARRRGERASAAVWIYTNFFFCDVQNSCCQAKIAQNPPGISEDRTYAEKMSRNVQDLRYFWIWAGNFSAYVK